jgi:predicted RNase H-like HicB family nuclease
MMTDAERDAEVRRRMLMPYHRVIHGEPVEGYLGEVLELRGCLTAGDTPEEALAHLNEAMAGWFDSCLLDGQPIPEPAKDPIRLTA